MASLLRDQAREERADNKVDRAFGKIKTSRQVIEYESVWGTYSLPDRQKFLMNSSQDLSFNSAHFLCTLSLYSIINLLPLKEGKALVESVFLLP